MAPPPLVAVVLDDGALRTFVNGEPFAHGLAAGDVVRASAHPACKIGELTVRATAAALPADAASSSSTPTTRASCASTAPASTGCAPGHLRPARAGPRPWCVHFNKPGSLPAHAVGFPPTAVQWDVDGTVEDDAGRRRPPFEAPYSHSLDHPDYVLLTFSESAGAQFEHSYSGESRAIFCKLSLYPLFREERALPRDTTLARGGLARFTLTFWNPDMRTPYRFHGVHFSFSLSFYAVPPHE